MTNRKFFLWYGLAIAALMFLVYHSLLGAEFVRWDDDLLILDNPIVHGITPWTLWKIFTTYDPELYIPFTLFSYQLNAVMGGLNPLLYHLTNIVLHTISAITLSGIVFFLTKKRHVAAVVGALFAIHPLHTESVAWISARKDVLSVTFFLFSILCYLFFQEKEERRFFYWSIAFFIAALLSKIIAVTLPAVLLLIDWHRGKLLQKKQLLQKIPFFLGSIVFAVVALGGKTKQVESSSLIETILMAGRSSAFYLQQLFAPFHFSLSYPEAHSIELLTPVFGLSLLLISTITFVSLVLWKRYRTFFLCWAFFLGTLAPTFLLYRKGFDGQDIYFASDRYAYIPSIGIILLFAIFLERLLRRYRHVYIALSLILIGSLSFLSYKQSLVWQSSETLFTHTLNLYPTAQAIHSNFGMVHLNKGRLTEAEEHFKSAIALRPVPNTYANLGALYRHKGMWNESLGAYQSALSLSSSDYDTYFGLGVLFTQRQEYDKAESFYRKAISIEPNNAGGYLNLGGLFAQQQRWQDAIDHYSIALAHDPFYANAHFNLGAALKRIGRTEEAKTAFLNALRYNPELEPAKAHLRQMQ